MADEITINASLVYEDSNGVNESISVTDKKVTVTTKRPIHTTVAVLVTEVAIPLGPLASLGQAQFKNLDPTNYIEILDGTGGTVVGKMFPGESYGPVRLGSGMQAPFAIANSGTCQMEILICAP